MGVTASLIRNSSSDGNLPIIQSRNSFFGPSACSSSSSLKQENHQLNEDNLHDEIQQLRSQLKQQNVILFPNPIVFIFFAPPEYPTVNAALYLSRHVNLPVIYPTEYIVDKYGTHYSQQQMMMMQQLQQQEQQNSHSPRPQPSQQHSHHQPQQPQRQQSLEILNVSTRKFLRKSSSIQENPTRANLLRRIQQEDCQRGFILYEYPDTITEMKYFKNNMIPNCKIEIIHLKLDNETMRNLIHKFDRWIHEPSGRSYHLCTNPPRSFVDSNYNPCPENMTDDETGEPLKQLFQDTVEHYKDRLHHYEIRDIPMFYEFEECSHIVVGGTCEKDVHRSILKTVYDIRVNEMKAKHTSTAESLTKPTTS